MGAMHRGKIYTSDEVIDAILPVAKESNIISIYVQIPKVRWPRQRQIDILYYPSPEFTLEDQYRMESIRNMIPDVVVVLYQSMFDRVRGIIDSGAAYASDRGDIGSCRRFPDTSGRWHHRCCSPMRERNPNHPRPPIRGYPCAGRASTDTRSRIGARSE